MNKQKGKYTALLSKQENKLLIEIMNAHYCWVDAQPARERCTYEDTVVPFPCKSAHAALLARFHLHHRPLKNHEECK